MTLCLAMCIPKVRCSLSSSCPFINPFLLTKIHQTYTGRCIAGERCKFPHLWLRPQDKCPKCHNIVHPLCGFLTEEGDKYNCHNCHKPTNSDNDNDVPTTVSMGENSCDLGIKQSKPSVCLNTSEITAGSLDDTESVLSTITDTARYTTIEKDYFITSNQHQNKQMKDRDGDIWTELRKGVQKAIDEDIKSMMILRSQEVGLTVKTEGGPENVACWNDIGKAWRNDDSIDTAKKLYEVVHATFDDESNYEIYMEANVMNKLKIKYKDDEYKKKGCIARMIITRKSELNKLINKRSDATHQKKISSKRVKNNGDRKSKGTFTVIAPDKSTECYKRDGSTCDSEKSVEITQFNSLFYMEKIRKLEQERNTV